MAPPRFDVPVLETDRLRLTALVPEDADTLVDVLNDERLHEFIGGTPADRDELRDRFGAMVAGPANADEVWCNWVVRRRPDGEPVGTVQATLMRAGDQWAADVAWVIGVEWQGRGFASESARALVAWLRDRDVAAVHANIHPDHHASMAVARAAGLHQTDREVDGERVWELG